MKPKPKQASPVSLQRTIPNTQKPTGPLYSRAALVVVNVVITLCAWGIGFLLAYGLTRPPAPPICAADVWTVERFQTLSARAAMGQPDTTIGDSDVKR